MNSVWSFWCVSEELSVCLLRYVLFQRIPPHGFRTTTDFCSRNDSVGARCSSQTGESPEARRNAGLTLKAGEAPSRIVVVDENGDLVYQKESTSDADGNSPDFGSMGGYEFADLKDEMAGNNQADGSEARPISTTPRMR